MKLKVIISLFETVRLSVSISPRILCNSLKSIKESCFLFSDPFLTVSHCFQVLFRKYGWMKSTYLFPFYRIITSRYNFDDYASKGSTVYPVRKFHRNMFALQGAAPFYQPPAVGSGKLYSERQSP